MHQIIQNLLDKIANGDIHALEELGWCYDQGIHCRKSYKKAFYYYNLAAKKSKNPIIFYNLSLCHLLGQGTKKDDKKAFNLLKKATKNDHLDSYIALAWHHYNGIGTKKDINLAIKYYQKAQDILSNPASLFSLGQIFYDKKDFTKAKLYFEQAVKDFHHAKAAYYLARILFEDKNCEKDLTRAKKLLTFAAEKKVFNAKRLLNSKKFQNLF